MCMRSLSNGARIEDVYKFIDVQNLEDHPTIFEMKLTGYQNYLVTTLVGTYHKRGKEFCTYRNAFYLKTHYKKQDAMSLKLKKL